jgi:hypothetical protein
VSGDWKDTDCTGSMDKNGNIICSCKSIGPATVISVLDE